MSTEGTSGLLRVRNGHAHNRVTAVELFFDLVFVFAITQLSHALIHHFTLGGALETLLLLLAVWWIWIYTTWITNWLDPDRLPVRLMLLAMMLAGLILSASIPQAFAAKGLAFAAAYTSMQLGRTLFMLWALGRSSRGLTRNFQRVLIWLAVSAVFWIAGGLAAGSDRLFLWALALGIEYLSPIVGFWVPGLGRSLTSDWNVEGGHMAERCGLFVIIALGESILVTGAMFSELAWSPATMASFALSFAGSLAMWWLYFDTAAEVGSERISHSADPGRMARLAYTYLHLVLVAGIILSAVADELVLAHPGGHTDLKTTIAVLGGAALYLLGNSLFKGSISGRLPVSPLLGILALALAAPVAGQVAPLALLAWATAVLVAIAAWERRARRWCPALQLSATDSGHS